MNKKMLVSLCVLGSFFSFGQANIGAARNLAIGQTVTVRGVATNGPELGAIRYIQDGTGAIPAYGSNLSSVLRGDSVEVTGVLYDYNGLLEISPTNSFQALGTSTTPSALPLPISNVGEAYEAQLLRFDNVTFTQTGIFAGNTNYTVTDGTNTLQVRATTGTNLVGVAIPTGPVTVFGLLGQFNTFQLLPRDANDIIPYVAPNKEINVKIGGVNYLTGTQYVVGTNSVTSVTIQNLGIGNLTVSGAGFSGTNASEFSSSFTNQIIGGNGTANLTIQFNPTGNGSRFGTLTINSDDADEGAYVINLYGIGNDNIASQPTVQPTGLVFSNVKAYAFNGTFTASSTAENYVVVWSNGVPVAGAPVDGTTYQRGDIIGNGKIAYIGPATAFAPRHVIANQTYHIAVYAFNGPAGFENYRTAAPLTGTVTSQGQQIGAYYAGVNSTSTSFISDLTALINPHTVITYGNYKPTVMNQFEVRDTTQGRSFVVCSYTGERKVFNDPFDWTAVGYSREHSYCHSWMPTFPADGTPSKPEYSDQHNLYPVNQIKANSVRSNLPMDIITGNVVYNYLDGSAGYNGAQLVYEPRDEQKGNAARAMMYMATAYNGISGFGWGLGANQPQAIIKSWHYQDLPDNYEIARNEYIFSQQNNRNPFVDSVDFACVINFTNMTYDATNCGLSIDELLQANFTVFPVPASTDLYLQVNGLTIESYTIVDATGKCVASNGNQSLPVVHLSTADFAKGIYVVSVTTPKGVVSRNLVIE
jgi:endonuclease I/DNA/RNA endonuclease YhcR with UshA esterase domain